MTVDHLLRRRRAEYRGCVTVPRPDVGHAVALGAAALVVLLAYATAIHPLLSITIVSGGVVAYLVLAHAQGMLLLLVAIMPWEALLRYPSEQVSVVKLAGVLLGGAYLLRVAAGRAPLQSTRTLLTALAFLALVLLSLMFSGDVAASVGKTLRYVLFVVFFFLLVQLAADRTMVLRVVKTFVLSMAPAAVYATVLAAQAEGAFAAGPIENPNDFGFLLLTTLPLAVYLAFEERPRALWSACVLVLFVGMLATVSRGALAGMAGMLVWAVATRRVPVRWLLAAAAVAGAVVLVGTVLASPVIEQRLDAKGNVAEENAASRLSFWSAAVYMSADHPLTGVGPGRFGEEGVETYIWGTTQGLGDPVTHSTYLEILAENGVPALAAFVAMLAGTGVALGRLRRRCEEVEDRACSRLAGALQASLVAAAVAGLFLSGAVIISFWLVTGLAAALTRGLLQESPGPETLSGPARAANSPPSGGRRERGSAGGRRRALGPAHAA